MQKIKTDGNGSHSKIIIAGLGPGSLTDITPAALDALSAADVVVGYKY